MFNWLKGKKWLIVNAILVGVLASTLGIQVVDRSDVADRLVRFGIGNEVVITLGHITYAAGSVDYTYDGVDDNVQFQAALNALPVTGGRIVDVSAVRKNFSATVTRVTDNVIITGAGQGSYFTNDGLTALFTAGGNGWQFESLRTDAGGINMGATTGWMWVKVNNGTNNYDLRTPAGSIINGTFVASSITDTGLTSGRVPVVSTGGLISNSANLTFDGASLQVSGDNVTRMATYVIAASDSTDGAKAQADVVFTGVPVTDTTMIQDLVGSNVSMFFRAGTYTLRPRIGIFNLSNFEIYGEHGAVLKPADQVISLLTADTLTGSTTVVVADASDYVPGMWLGLVDGNSQHVGENRVLKVNHATNTLTIMTAVTSDITVAQNGKAYGGGIVLYTENVTGVSIHDLEFDMNASGYTEFTRPVHADLCGYNQAIRNGDDAENYLIYNITVHDGWGYAMSLHTMKELTVRNSSANNTGGGVVTEGTKGDVTIEGLHILGQKDRGSGITIGGTASQDTRRVSVLGNIIENSPYQGGIFVDVYAYDVVIANNAIYNSDLGIRTSGGTGTIGSSYSVTGNVIANSNVGIQNNAKKAVISGNIVNGYYNTNGAYQYYTAGADTTFVGNLGIGGYREGFLFAPTANRSSAIGNTITDCNAGSGNYSAFMVSDAPDVQLLNNIANDTRTPKLTPYAISVSASALRTVVRGNDARGYLIRAIHNSSNSTILEDNLGYQTPPLSTLDANYAQVPLNGGWDTTLLNSGTVTQAPFGQTAQLANSINSSALAYTIAYGFSDFANDVNQVYVNWDKRLIIQFNYTRYNSDVNASAYFQLKEVNTEGVLADYGLGIYADNLFVNGESFGTLNTPPAIMPLYASGAATLEEHQIRIELEPYLPRISWFVDGVLTISVSDLDYIPRGDSNATCYFVHSIKGGDPAVGGGTRSVIKNLQVWQER